MRPTIDSRRLTAIFFITMHLTMAPLRAASLVGMVLLGTSVSASRQPLPSWKGCPPGGPLLPRPTDLSRSQIVKDATADLTRALNSAIDGKTKAGFPVDNTSFSIALVSPFDQVARDEDSSFIWTYHHLGKNNVNGTKNLDNDSQYLIGSISKVFTDLLLLKSDVDLSDPVTKYLPDLAKEGSPIQWSNITLSALSNHLAGIPSNLPSSFEFYALQPLYNMLGFPKITKEDYETCGVAGLNKACNGFQIIEMMHSALPIREPYDQPLYSTLSFSLIALALSYNEKEKTYEQLLDEIVIKPLGLSNTGVSPGDTEKAVIPPLSEEKQGWGADYGLSAPGGGLYSSLRDLATLAARTLDFTILPDQDKAHEWLKPQSMTSSVFNTVGRPWEIQRADDLVPENPHTVDIYAKSGGAMGYVSQLSLVDQYGVGFVVLTAGPQEVPVESILNDAVISSLIPAIDKEARQQAQKYTGNFTSAQTQAADDAPVKLSLSADNGGTGLKINSLTRNGSDILSGIEKLWDTMIPQTGILNPDFRIYPTGIENSTGDVVQEDWRISFDIVPPDNAAASDLPGQGSLSSKLCSSWQTSSWLYYGGEALDRIVFSVDRKAGKVVGVDIPVLCSGVLVHA